ncbi:MAG: M14 family zinc carboxypeptidase [Bacteroidota bacterium]
MVFSLKRYDQLAAKSGAKIITIGSSEKGAPIKVLKKGTGRLKILFIARIHGNEPATTEALLEFFNENNFDDLELYGIFLANPDGAALYEELQQKKPEPYWENNFNDARLNSNGVDINRDWMELTQKETQAIQKFILDLRPDFTVDFHEYYWSDKGYPPKYPYDDEDGFMATMTDAPFYGADSYVKELSEQPMNYLIKKLGNEFNWKIKPRHFVGEKYNSEYQNPGFLGIYLALRGIPKLLIETWGVACSTLLLDKRIAFHKKAMYYLLEWIRENKIKFFAKNESIREILSFNINNFDTSKKNIFIGLLDKHRLNYEINNDKSVSVHCSSLETGFVNTIYYLIFEKEEQTNETT